MAPPEPAQFDRVDKYAPVFDGDAANWDEWRNQFESFTQLTRLRGCLDGTDTNAQRQQDLFAHLALAVRGAAGPIVRHSTKGNGHAAWEALCRHYEPSTNVRLVHVVEQFLGIRKKDDEPIRQFFWRFETLKRRVEEATTRARAAEAAAATTEGEVPAAAPPFVLEPLIVTAAAMRALPSVYRPTISSLGAVGRLTYDAIRDALLANEDRDISLDSPAAGSGDVIAAIGEQRTCYNCNRKGHLSANCPDRKLGTARPQQAPFCNYHKTSGHATADCRALKKRANPPGTTAAAVEGAEASDTSGEIFASGVFFFTDRPSDWLLDSGASAHLTNNKANRKGYVELPSPSRIRTVGRPVQCLGYGTCHINTHEGSMTLRNSSVKFYFMRSPVLAAYPS